MIIIGNYNNYIQFKKSLPNIYDGRGYIQISKQAIKSI